MRAAVAPAAVLPRKLAALAEVSPTYGAARYPFVHGPSQVFAGSDPDDRRRLAEAIPQLGATRRLDRAGPAPAPRTDLISVIVPYFDMHAFIDETVAAVEAQDHDAVELIIVDDGSRIPEGRDKLDALLTGPRRFATTVLRKTNGGLADARNSGAKAARGEYLYFLDADDLIHPSTLSRSLDLLKRFDNVGYVGAGLKEFGDSEGEWSVFDVDGPYIAFHNLQICAFLVRAEAWLAHGVNDPQMVFGMEDLASHISLAAAGVHGVAIPEPLFSYRKRAGSMSRAFEPHANAYLYRRIRQANPALFRRFGPELVGLYAENGHGAMAPSVCEPSPAHSVLLGRDIPGLDEVADNLELHASHHQLGRALRARCAGGGAEWNYTAGRLLLALDCAPAFGRQLLRAAVTATPDNGWFRLYSMIAELRDGRLGAAQALCGRAVDALCGTEEGAVRWIVALEAARGFPHVALALRALLGEACGAPVAASPTHLSGTESKADSGDFAALHVALDQWRASPPGKGDEAAREAVRAAAVAHVSPDATDALLRRWLQTWRNAEARPASAWGQGAAAYLRPAALPASTSGELQERGRWMALAVGGHIPAPQRLVQTLRQVARRAIHPA